VYYSLELYTWDYPNFHRFFNARRIKYAEERYHREAAATIIQDAARARHLLADNGIADNAVVLHMPVSLIGDPITTRSDYFQQRQNVSANDTIILQLGQISERRFGHELVSIAQRFPPTWRLAFHGWGTPNEIEKLKRADQKKSVLLSLDHLPWHRLYDVLTSADVGLVLYRDHCANDRMTVFASEKMALYLQCGLPVVVFNYEGYELVEDRGCGVCISDLSELPHAVSRILENHDKYRRNSHACFRDYYEASRYFPPIQRFLDRLGEDRMRR
jgi:glycosyltransferase involved in cell wall biosynthesis